MMTSFCDFLITGEIRQSSVITEFRMVDVYEILVVEFRVHRSLRNIWQIFALPSINISGKINNSSLELKLCEKEKASIIRGPLYK